jgi:phosphoglycolate phosphatase-like HAD superfamily hydrolase
MNLIGYDRIIFDCDGVILDSNNIKAQAFYDITVEYGVESANAFLSYCRKNWGTSRWKLLEGFYREIFPVETRKAEELVEKKVKEFGDKVKESLIKCPLTKGLKELIHKLPTEKCYIVSGSSQSELREVFFARKMNKFFKEIYGSPRNKLEIVEQESLAGGKTLFIGDSLKDFECAQSYHMDFIFMYGYTDFSNWKVFFKDYPEVTLVQNTSVLTYA